MKCTVLTVGTEILFGSIVNTNAVYLSRQLQSLSVDVMYHMTVGDNPKRLKEMLDYAFRDCDMVITTGGLGPTEDDLTKEMIAEYFGEKNIPFDDQMKILEAHFAGNGRTMTENNRKQAYFPENADILANPNGTAPGFWLEKNGKIIVSMPGPPSEMQPMFENEVKPRLLERQGAVLYFKDIMTVGIGESALETALIGLIDGQTDPTIATYAADFQCRVRVASKRKTLDEARAAVDNTVDEIRKIVGEYIFSEEGEPLAKVVIDILRKKGLKLSSCESCTGGMFGAAITDIAGASDVFDRSLVTYTEEAKMQQLGVKPETLEKYSAVSRKTAIEMAEGLQQVSGSDICVSVTGYAGPGGGTDDDPVGTFYIGLVCGGRSIGKRFTTTRPTRERVRKYAVLKMLCSIYDEIK